MGIRISGRYRPTGKISVKRSTIAPIFVVNPTIMGGPYIGGTFTANAGTFSPNSALVSYLWTLDGIQVSTTNTVVIAAPGTLILKVTISNSEGSTEFSTPGLIVMEEPLAFGSNPVIQYSSLQLGSTFTAVDASYGPSDATFSRAWKLNGTLIGSGTSVTPVSSGVLVLENTITKGSSSITLTDQVNVISENISFTSQPVISYSNLYVGSIFTATDGTYTPNDATFSRTWKLNGNVIGSGTTIQPLTSGTLVLENSITKSGITVTTSTQVSVVYEPIVVLTSASIQSDNSFVGSTFTAVDATFTPSDATITRQWSLNSVVIGSGTSVTPNASGTLVLLETISKNGQTATSSAILNITYRTPVFNTNPSISPVSGVMGDTFIGNDGSYSYGTVLSRQWLLNGQNIPGANTQMYVSDGIGTLTYSVIIQNPDGVTTSAVSSGVTSSSIPEKLNPPTWVSQPGLLGTFAEGSTVSIPILAEDPENNIQKYEVTSGTLPVGLTLNLTTGLLSGTLAEVISDTVYSFTIKVTDRSNLTLTGNFTLNVANVKTTVTWQTDNTSDIASPAPGEQVNVTIQATSE